MELAEFRVGSGFFVFFLNLNPGISDEPLQRTLRAIAPMFFSFYATLLPFQFSLQYSSRDRFFYLLYVFKSLIHTTTTTKKRSPCLEIDYENCAAKCRWGCKGLSR